MRLTPPPTFASVLDCKKVYQKSVNEKHLAFSVIYLTQASILSTLRRALHASARKGEDVLPLHMFYKTSQSPISLRVFMEYWYKLDVRDTTDARLYHWYGICRPGHGGMFRRVWRASGLCR